MMTNQEIIAVVQAAENGAEIEMELGPNEWVTTSTPNWSFYYIRYRVKPPAKKIVKSLAWRNKHNGNLMWSNSAITHDGWQRYPCADFEEEVEE